MEIKLEQWQKDILSEEWPEDPIRVGRRCGLQGLRIMMDKLKRAHIL